VSSNCHCRLRLEKRALGSGRLGASRLPNRLFRRFHLNTTTTTSGPLQPTQVMTRTILSRPTNAMQPRIAVAANSTVTHCLHKASHLWRRDGERSDGVIRYAHTVSSCLICLNLVPVPQNCEVEHDPIDRADRELTLENAFTYAPPTGTLKGVNANGFALETRSVRDPQRIQVRIRNSTYGCFVSYDDSENQAISLTPTPLSSASSNTHPSPPSPKLPSPYPQSHYLILPPFPPFPPLRSTTTFPLPLYSIPTAFINLNPALTAKHPSILPTTIRPNPFSTPFATAHHILGSPSPSQTRNVLVIGSAKGPRFVTLYCKLKAKMRDSWHNSKSHLSTYAICDL
jgi:hypothetical protein